MCESIQCAGGYQAAQNGETLVVPTNADHCCSMMSCTDEGMTPNTPRECTVVGSTRAG